MRENSSLHLTAYRVAACIRSFIHMGDVNMCAIALVLVKRKMSCILDVAFSRNPTVDQNIGHFSAEKCTERVCAWRAFPFTCSNCFFFPFSNKCQSLETQLSHMHAHIAHMTLHIDCHNNYRSRFPNACCDYRNECNANSSCQKSCICVAKRSHGKPHSLQCSASWSCYDNNKIVDDNVDCRRYHIIVGNVRVGV